MIFTEVYVKTPGFVEKRVGDETILVPISTEVAQMSEVFTLNELASFIWNHLDGKSTLNDIVKDVVDCYDVVEQTVISDVVDFIEAAIRNGVIRIV